MHVCVKTRRHTHTMRTRRHTAYRQQERRRHLLLEVDLLLQRRVQLVNLAPKPLAVLAARLRCFLALKCVTSLLLRHQNALLECHIFRLQSDRLGPCQPPAIQPLSCS